MAAFAEIRISLAPLSSRVIRLGSTAIEEKLATILKMHRSTRKYKSIVKSSRKRRA
jgi:hypothetical protein